MKVEYSKDGMMIVPEDYRDDLFLREALQIDKGKVFCRVIELEGKWEVKKAIEIVLFDDKISKSHHKPTGSSGTSNMGNR